MIIHVHGALEPQSGELKRMKNIDRDFVSIMNEKSIELVFYPASKKDFVKKQPMFTLSENVVKKVMVPVYPYIAKLTSLIVYIYMVLRYRPTAVVWEMFMSVKGASLVKKISPKTKVIIDIHGAAAEEAAYQGESIERVSSLRIYEKKAVNLVDYIICQSDEMKRYIVREYGVNSSKVCVYRCGVDINHFRIDEIKRKTIRQKLGFREEDIVFVYSGGLHPWQRVGEALDLFEKYHDIIRASKFLVLTGSGEELHEMIKKKGIDNSDNHIVSMCLPFVEVPDYLNACDVAFLLRHNHTMNAVASPTKLAEYLACGLPVISSRVSMKWVTPEAMKFVIVEEDMSDVEDITRVVNDTYRNDVSKYAAEYLSLDVDRKAISDFFCNK